MHVNYTSERIQTPLLSCRSYSCVDLFWNKKNSIFVQCCFAFAFLIVVSCILFALISLEKFSRRRFKAARVQLLVCASSSSRSQWTYRFRRMNRCDRLVATSFKSMPVDLHLLFWHELKPAAFCKHHLQAAIQNMEKHSNTSHQSISQ